MTPSRQRLAFLVIVLALLATVAIVQLVRFQIVEGTPSGSPSFSGLAGQAGPSMRGRIWDRSGQLLATDDTRYEVLFDRINGDVTGTIREVTPILDIPSNDFRATINVTYGQVVITRGLLPDMALRVNDLKIHGVSAQAYWPLQCPAERGGCAACRFDDEARRRSRVDPRSDRASDCRGRIGSRLAGHGREVGLHHRDESA